MTLRFPLAVRISDGTTDRHVTAQASRLQYKTTAPGGFHSMSVHLDIDPATFSDLGPADRVWVYGPTGKTLWEGFIDNPGAQVSEEGVGFDLAAMGTIVLASDQARALPYLQRDLDDWTQNQASATATSANASVSDDPMATPGGDTDQGLLCQFNPGQPVDTGSVAQIGYSALANAGMELGVVGLTVKSGITDANYRADIITSAGPGTAGVLSIGTTNTTPANIVRYVAAGGSFPAGQNRVALQLRRTGGATTVGNDNTWSWFYNVAIAARRMDVSGVLLDAVTLQTQGGATSVRADHIAADLVGRVLAVVDPNSVTIDAASYPIDQISFTEPVTAAEVFRALEVFEPDFTWEFLGSTGNGYAFNYRAWPTTVRYEISTQDGYSAPGSDYELVNRIVVKWTDTKGIDRTTTVTAASRPGITVAGVAATVYASGLSALEDTGRIRDAESITLPAGRGSAANAQRVGEQTLTALANPPKAGTARVRRPVVDLLYGGLVMPYEIEAGYLCRVRELGDVLRLTEVDVDAEAGDVVLTLGQPQLTTEQRIEQLVRTAPKR